MTESEKTEIELKVALVLFETKAVKINITQPFTFASGIRSPIYCDNRCILGFPEQRKVIENAFIKRIGESEDIIAGVASAGVPWASFAATALNKPLSYVRSAAKDHGTGSVIEGACVQGKRVVLIEDLISTGKSSLAAVKSLRNRGAVYVSVQAIFSYQFEQAKLNFASADCPFESLSNFSALIDLLQKEHYLSATEAQSALMWNKSPETWAASYADCSE